MVVNKRKKASRYRASMTHGSGAKKKRRGSGNRGGKGNAGSGKKAECKKPTVSKDIHYFGKFGFKSKGITRDIRAVNLGYIDENIQSLLKDNKVSKENGAYALDLESIGFNKLLGDGMVTNKLRIKAKYASSKAVEKVNALGGEVILS